jgi:protein-tyrosine phosphatase
VIDLHSHVLPGVDDGCATLAESLELVRASAADGVTVLAATPHVRADYPTSPDMMEVRVERVREAVADAGIAVEILPGGEIALDRLDLLDEGELRRFGLGGNQEVLLLEFPYAGWPLALEEQLFHLQAAGFTPVLGHPERNAEVQAAPRRLAPLVERGVLVQVTAASLDGRLGRRAREAAMALVDDGLTHLVASDAHTPEIRTAGLSDAAAALDPDIAQWLTRDVPAALVVGGEMPERPEPPRRGRRFRFRLGGL